MLFFIPKLDLVLMHGMKRHATPIYLFCFPRSYMPHCHLHASLITATSEHSSPVSGNLSYICSIEAVKPRVTENLCTFPNKAECMQ